MYMYTYTHTYMKTGTTTLKLTHNIKHEVTKSAERVRAIITYEM